MTRNNSLVQKMFGKPMRLLTEEERKIYNREAAKRAYKRKTSLKYAHPAIMEAGVPAVPKPENKPPSEYIKKGKPIAQYRKERRAMGKDINTWPAREANRRAGSHQGKVKKRYYDIWKKSSLTTGVLANWWDEQEKVCYICGRDGRDFDHIIPLSRGGEHELSNIRICCASCNSKKHDRTLEEMLPYINKQMEDILIRVEELHRERAHLESIKLLLEQDSKILEK
jgi:5-methylcytosine-specific restriction endonuclease McrA